jgi:acyl-CoA thioester hydrolase
VENASFRYLLRVRYGECDGQKIVYNARYGEYVDLAATEFLRVVWGDAMFGGGFDYRLIRQVLEWKSPARYDQVLSISVRGGRIGTTSFTLSMELRALHAEPLLVTAETTYVLVRESDQSKHPVPPDLRGKLEAGAPGIVVDHAGAGVAGVIAT